MVSPQWWMCPKGRQELYYYSEGDGGINVGMTREKVFGWYATGCWPAPAGSTSDPDGRLDTPNPSEFTRTSPPFEGVR